MGFTIMESFMDELEVESVQEVGTKNKNEKNYYIGENYVRNRN